MKPEFPVFKLKQNGKKIAVNPNHVTAVYADKEDVTDIYTLDCARSADAWDVDAPFDEVNEKISASLAEFMGEQRGK